MSFIAYYYGEKKVNKIFSKILFLNKILNEFFFANHFKWEYIEHLFKTKNVYPKLSIGWM